MADGVQGGFRRTWEVEVLRAQPLIAPARRYTYPREVIGEEEAMARGAMELMVRPGARGAGGSGAIGGSEGTGAGRGAGGGGGAFLATCSLGFKDPGMPTGVWSCPRAEEMCAVAGGYAYVVDTTAPERVVQVPLRPVTAVRVLEAEGLLVFAGFTSLVGWGAEGLRWETGRLSWEGVTLGAVVDGRLTGTGWEMVSDRELAFAVDLGTGRHEGGGYLR